jgi:hypothetical protein
MPSISQMYLGNSLSKQKAHFLQMIKSPRNCISYCALGPLCIQLNFLSPNEIYSLLLLESHMNIHCRHPEVLTIVFRLTVANMYALVSFFWNNI